MLPERKREAAEAGGSHGGFEVRVIGSSAPASAEVERTVSGVELGLVIGGGARKPRPVAADEGPVHRLEVEDGGDQLKVRDMSEVGPAVPRVSSRAKKKRFRLEQLTIWMAVGVCGIAVATVGGLLTRKLEPAQPSSPGIPEAAPISASQLEEAYFVSHANELTQEAESSLRKYAEATTADEALPFLRDRDRVATAVHEKWKAWGSNPKFSTHEKFVTLVGTDSTRPKVSVAGRKGDFTPFTAVFVREGGRLVLDWEATEGIGDLQVLQLKKGAEAKDATVRVHISPSSYYNPDFPEEKYRSYKLEGKADEAIAWGYMALDSPAAEALKQELNEDSFIMEESSETKLTLKVTGPVRPGSNQYLITEMLHKDWVSP